MKIKAFSTNIGKKILFIAIIIVISVTIVISQVVIGDPDNNGNIDIVDALIVAQYYVGLNPASFNPDGADVDCTGSIDIVDALLIAQHYVGLINGFPQCNATPLPTPDPGTIDYTELIENWARELGIDLTGYNIVQIQSDSIEYVIPSYTFFLLYLIQYPVAYGPPDEQLGTNCIVAIDSDFTIEMIPNEQSLQTFYQAHQIAITTEEGCVQAIKAWLALSQEFKNDGYYTFLISDDDIVVSFVSGDVVIWRVEGISRVVSGGEGAITALMAIDLYGLLSYVEEEFELIPGIRPICQSTKLLDKDPIVRKMAEQDLLAMGYSAKDYLFSQRAISPPELQKAIDAIWERIHKQEEKRKQIIDLLSDNR